MLYLECIVASGESSNVSRREPAVSANSGAHCRTTALLLLGGQLAGAQVTCTVVFSWGASSQAHR